MFASIMQNIAEQKILEAQKKGLFENLPGSGKPLELRDESHIPPELRIPYAILRNSGHLPAELEERREIGKLLDLLDDMSDEKEILAAIGKIKFRIMQAGIRARRKIWLEEHDPYFDRLLRRMQEHERRLG